MFSAQGLHEITLRWVVLSVEEDFFRFVTKRDTVPFRILLLSFLTTSAVWLSDSQLQHFKNRLAFPNASCRNETFSKLGYQVFR